MRTALVLLCLLLSVVGGCAPDRTVVAFGSCSNIDKYPSQPIFARMQEEKVRAVFLIGDTPYIDTTDLAKQRERYAKFFAVPELAALGRTAPVYATWDDHDFGKNDVDGRLPNKSNSRIAFVESHPDNPSFGDGKEGIYTKVSVGPVDVFLIDARWFSRTAPSFADPNKPTLLGEGQWGWLTRELKASKATFKILTTGMIWNDSVRPMKTDFWGAYAHERAALMKFIAVERITGVVLMGGDIHRSRALLHPTGFWGNPYPMLELISSPLANDVHANSDVPHPNLLAQAGLPQLCMIVEVRGDELTARCIDHEGRERFRAGVRAHDLK